MFHSGTSIVFTDLYIMSATILIGRHSQMAQKTCMAHRWHKVSMARVAKPNVFKIAKIHFLIRRPAVFVNLEIN